VTRKRGEDLVYEHRHMPMSRAAFIRRFLFNLFISSLLVFASLALGMVGYEHYEHLSWQAAFVNAAMLLGGMGPVDPPTTNPGRIFEGLYALYAGLIFLIVAGVLLAPVIHRVLHLFHFEGPGDDT
jgi:hypothetical protein